MKVRSLSTLPMRKASEALLALLGQISSIRRQSIRIEFPPAGPSIDLLANVEVFGHSHMLACAYRENESLGLEKTIRKLCQSARTLGDAVRPVLIAPRLSAATQTFCRTKGVDYLDLEGNARLNLNEVFIALQSYPGAEALKKPTGPQPPEFAVRSAIAAA